MKGHKYRIDLKEKARKEVREMQGNSKIKRQFYEN